MTLFSAPLLLLPILHPPKLTSSNLIIPAFLKSSQIIANQRQLHRSSLILFFAVTFRQHDEKSTLSSYPFRPFFSISYLIRSFDAIPALLIPPLFLPSFPANDSPVHLFSFHPAKAQTKKPDAVVPALAFSVLLISLLPTRHNTRNIYIHIHTPPTPPPSHQNHPNIHPLADMHSHVTRTPSFSPSQKSKTPTIRTAHEACDAGRLFIALFSMHIWRFGPCLEIPLSFLFFPLSFISSIFHPSTQTTKVKK